MKRGVRGIFYASAISRGVHVWNSCEILGFAMT